MFGFGFPYNTTNPLTDGGGFDPDAEAFFTASGITDTTQKNAVNQLVLDLKSYNIWTKMKALYPIVGGTSSSHAVNLKTPGTYNLTFSTGWTHASTGMTPSTAYANTGLNASTNLTANTNHLSVYVRTNQTTNAVPIGSYHFNNVQLFQLNVSTGTGCYFYTGGLSTEVTSSISDSKGLFMGSQRAINDRKIFRNGIALASLTSTLSSNNPSYTIYLGARNQDNTASSYTTQQIAFSSIGDGLTDTDAANFYTAVQAYQTTLGRSVGTQTVSDSDAQAFVTAASIQDQVEATAVNNLVIGLKEDSLWTKMKAIYPIVGGSASSHAVNLKTPGTYNLTFSTGWTHASTGMTPNGSSAYADTSFIPSGNLTLHNAHLSVYNRTSSFGTSGGKVWIGASSNGGVYSNKQQFYLYSNVATSQLGAVQNSEDPATDIAYKGSFANRSGFIINTRTSTTATSLKLWKNGVAEANATTSGAGQTLNTSSLYLGAIRNMTAGSPYAQLYNDGQYAFTSIGDGLTDTEANNLNTRVQNFQTELNRQV